MDLGAGPNNRSPAEKTKMSSVEGSGIEMKKTEAVISPQVAREMKQQNGGSKSEVKKAALGTFLNDTYV